MAKKQKGPGRPPGVSSRGRKPAPNKPKGTPGRKKKPGAKKKVDVKGATTKQKKGYHWVDGHWQQNPKRHRKKAHKRNQRRTEAEILEKGTRKEERMGKSDTYRFSQLRSLLRKKPRQPKSPP